LRAALLQLCSGDDPATNLVVTETLMRKAASVGADLMLTPECTHLV
jgi:predicted amidohydrolase